MADTKKKHSSWILLALGLLLLIGWWAFNLLTATTG
jgi:hypothetical protein